MSFRRQGLVVLVLAALSALSVLTCDVAVARWVAGLPAGVHRTFDTCTHVLDTVSGKGLADSAPGFVLLALGLVAWLRPAWRPLARLLVVVALSNLVSHLCTGVLKGAFGRLRPYEIGEAGWKDRFFAGGASYPSGHATFYWGLLLPLAWGLPRWRALVLAPALYIAVARVLERDHFPGDVLAGIAVATLVSSVLIVVFERACGLAPLLPRTRAS